MRIWLPRTMTGLVAAGCLLAAMPLLAAVVLAGVALERLSRQGEALVEEGVTVARLGSELRDDVGNLERNARQYVALQDPALLEVFFDRLRETEVTLGRIEARKGLQAPFVEHMTRLRQGLAQAARDWMQGLPDAEALAAAADRIHTLTPETEAMIAAGRESVDDHVEELREATTVARRVMLLSALALIPLTAVLAFGFSVAVTRPLKRMSRGITALGNARYEQPIAIVFPSEMRRLGERLDWLRRRLAQLDADKDRFLRHVSHELKTPLASLCEGAELLREGSLGALTPRQREVAQIMAESAAELVASIDNLLAYAEWREERRQAQMAWFETRPLAEEVLAAHVLTLARRQLSAELELQTPRLFGQRSQLRAALGNLVANAVKYAPAGSVIELRAAALDGHFELSVRDRGAGVPDSDKERIFEPFVRGSHAEASAIRGSGIGLSIVKEAALAHSGNAEVEDAQPGARFKLAWPCPQPGPQLGP
jgi:two-component system sensor histidine kinase GlrK